MKNLQLILSIICITLPMGGSLASPGKGNKGYPRILTFIKSKFNSEAATVVKNEMDKNPKQQAAAELIHESARKPLSIHAASSTLKGSAVASVPNVTTSVMPASTCEFAIIIPSYNNERYYEENLNSVCWQNSTNPYHIYYINDCSTDATGRLVEEYIKKNGLERKVTLINNPINIGGGANIYKTIHNYVANHKIVVLLDGDDLFAHNNVLLTLENYYKDQDLWMTYGSAIAHPSGEPVWYMSEEVPSSVFHDKKIREYPFITQHLRTFKAALYKKIRKKDFYYKDQFMRVTWDVAFMLPMLEMSYPNDRAAKPHCAFVKEILYLYRTNNPLNDFRVRGELQREVEQYIKALKPYQPLDSLVSSLMKKKGK